MKILVPTKRVADADQKIRVAADGKSIEEDDLPFMVNPFDSIALEEALQIRESSHPEAEIVTVGIGSDQYESELRTTLAMGADRAVLVESDEAMDSWNVACILHAIVKREKPDLILMGKQAVDGDCNQTGQFLAAKLDWPQATFASKVEFTDFGLRVARETDQGIEVIQVKLPAVVTVDLRLNEPRYASLPSILKAKKKPIERVDLRALGVTIDPKIRVVGLASVPSSRSCIKVGSVDELIIKLREEKVLG